MSSLENQLKRLRIPENSSLERASKYKKRTSFLFNSKEASDIDNETVFALALNGLDELKLVDVHFEKFESLLFSESSKHLERSLQTKEVNEKLDNTIRDYLQFLSPYILLKPAHKTLEWLIRRFQIQLYNIDDLLSCVFPFHHSNVFARVVQLLNITNTKWSWLISIQKTGSPLPRSTIIQHCLSNPAFISFISSLVFSAVKSKTQGVESSASCNVFSSFYASTIIGILQSLEKVSEELVSSLLNQIIHGLKSNVNDLQAASYMFIGQLSTKCTLQSSVVESLLKTMCKNVSAKLCESLLMSINCLCSSHSLTKFPKKAFNSLCKLPNMATLLCNLSTNYQMDSFLKVFVSYLIKVVLRLMVDAKDGENEAQSLLLFDLLRDMDVDQTLKMHFTRNILHEYIEIRRTHADEEDVIKLNNGVKNLARIIKNRWQAQMDKTVEDYLVSVKSDVQSEEEIKQNIEWTQDFVSMVLSNIGSQIVCDSGSTLVLALHHPNAEFRKLALKQVSDILKQPVNSDEDKEFLEESLLMKLTDDDPAVVLTVLKLKEGLINICHGQRLVTSLIKLLEKSSSKCVKVFEEALNILLSDKLLEKNPSSNDRILFHLMPLMFLRKKNVSNAKLIVDHLCGCQLMSEWLFKSLKKKTWRRVFEKCSEDSTVQDLAVANAMLLFTVAENISALETEAALETMKTMEEHAKETRDETFLIMFLTISVNVLNITKDDTQRFNILSIFFPQLLSLVAHVTQAEGTSKLYQELDKEVLERRRDGCGCVPVDLISNYIYMMKRKNIKKVGHVQSRIYLYLLEEVIKYLPVPRKEPTVWWTCVSGNKLEEQYTQILFVIFEVLLDGLGKGRQFAYEEEFQSCLETVIKVQLPKKLHLLRFLAFLWSNPARSADNQSVICVPSAVTVVQILHISQVMIKSLDEKSIMDIISQQSQVIPSLIVCLTSPVMAVRERTLQTISLIISRSTVKTAATVLGAIVCESSEEIKADEYFITSVLQRYFSSVGDSSSRRKSKSSKSSGKIHTDDVLEYILKHITNKETPSHVVRVLLTTLKKIVTKIFLLRCLPSMEVIINCQLKGKECSSDQSHILLNIIQKFTPSTANLLETEPKLFEIFLQLFNLSNPFSNGHISPQEAVLNQISAEFFEAMANEHIEGEVLGKLIDVSMDTSDPKISAKIKDVLKLIPISADQIQTELTKFANEDLKKTLKTKKSKTVVSEDWSSSLGSFWQRVIVIIELLQAKDNITQPETLLPILFKILSMCLEISEQTSSDYLRQLLLSTILKICQMHIDQGKSGKMRGVLSEDHFSVEQIIHCIRVSGNPQTHHHALSLLAIAAQLFPEKVLHNIMSIFTFMGVNVLRQDDTYSFQVIKRTVEAVVPAFIQAEKNQRNIEILATKILRVFVDAFPHVPEHRRLPIFVHLLTTVGTSSYLHVCLALLFEKISNKDMMKQGDEKHSGLIFCNSLCNEFSPEIQMNSLVQLLKYLSSLPEEKPEGYNIKRYSDTSGIVFDVNSHSEKELQQFKLSGIELVLSVLGNDDLVEKIAPLSSEKHEKMDHFCLSLLEATLQYVTSISKSVESSKQETTIKFLRVLLHKVYDIVEKVSNLLPGVAFVGIVSQLIQNSNPIIRRKAMELFNKRMAGNLQSYSNEKMEPLLVLLDTLLLLIQNEDETAINKQSAFHMVIILSRILDDVHSLSLKKVFPVAIVSCEDAKTQVVSSALLCLAELCSVLKVQAIPFLPKFLPRVLKIVEMKDSEERSDLLLLTALTVIHKVIQSLPNFVSPYLRNIITQLMSPAFIPLDESEQSSWKKQIIDRVISLRGDIAVLIKPRILVPNISQCYDDIVDSGNNDCIIILFQLLCECVTHMSNDDVKNHHKQLLSLFMSALDYPSQHGQGISKDRLLKTEDAIIDAFLSLIMRLSESLFRPMFLKLVDWATRSSSNKQRLLVFYHLADRMAEKLKGLFVLFAGYIIKNTASILDANNITKSEEMFFAADVDEEEAVEKSCQLLRYILDCLCKCFLYDNQRFLNKERFDRLLNPLVDQIENQIGANEVFHERITNHLAPCIAQFAAAAGDGSYWKTINHGICIRTRHSSSQVRLASLKVLQELNHRLGEEYLSLLPEIIPFLAELMEDESFEVEQQCQQVISEMENVLGESLQKYF